MVRTVGESRSLALRIRDDPNSNGSVRQLAVWYLSGYISQSQFDNGSAYYEKILNPQFDSSQDFSSSTSGSLGSLNETNKNIISRLNTIENILKSEEAEQHAQFYPRIQSLEENKQKIWNSVGELWNAHKVHQEWITEVNTRLSSTVVDLGKSAEKDAWLDNIPTVAGFSGLAVGAVALILLILLKR